MVPTLAHQVSPGKALWESDCTAANIKKLLAVKSYHTESCDRLYELRDELVMEFIGETYVKNFPESSKDCKQYRLSSDERLQCRNGKFVVFFLAWNGTSSALQEAMTKKYGNTLKSIPIHEWLGSDGSKMIRGYGQKTAVGTGYIHEKNDDRIIYSETYKSMGEYSNIIYFSPKLFDKLKQEIDAKKKTEIEKAHLG